MRREALFFLSNRAHSNGGRRQKRATEARASIEIAKARAASSLRTLTGEGRLKIPLRPRWPSVRIPSAVRANRRDFRGSEIARHFRSLCAESRSLRSGWHVQATFLGASRPKSLAGSRASRSRPRADLREIVFALHGEPRLRRAAQRLLKPQGHFRRHAARAAMTLCNC